MASDPKDQAHAMLNTPATSPGGSAQAGKPQQRVLACVLCQQRKIKCDRKFPCAHCVKSNQQCVPASSLPPRQRRRRFPERELLNRLRHCENLLRKHNIDYEPLHNAASDKRDSEAGSLPPRSHTPHPTSGNAAKHDTSYEARSIWSAMNQRPEVDDGDGHDSDSSIEDFQRAAVMTAWDSFHQTGDVGILFGAPNSEDDLATFHPQQVHMFKLWQLYIDNINPLLRVVHVPTTQSRIIDGAADLASIKPGFAALMFGVYCVAMLSISEAECQAMLGAPKDQLLPKFHYACRQALSKSGFLRTIDRECLVALYLYLVSVRSWVDPHSLASMLGVALRIAIRMGLHDESSNVKHSPFEAEMRRRLWWSLVMFDHRVCEMADYRLVQLGPTWNCRVPLNVNDSDLRPEMQDLPPVQGKSTDALFAVVRGEMGDFVRHCAWHLDFISPALKALKKEHPRDDNPNNSEIDSLATVIEEKYLQHCNPDNAFHFMIIWTSRSYLARARIHEHYSRFPALVSQTDVHRDAAIRHAVDMLECDTKIMTAPACKGYLWWVNMYFPMLAYIHIVQDFRRRPVSAQADAAWAAMSANYDARFKFLRKDNRFFFRLMFKFILQAWVAREDHFRRAGTQLVPPRLVLDIRESVTERRALQAGLEQLTPETPEDGYDFATEQLRDIFGPTFGTPAPKPYDAGPPSAEEGQVGQIDPFPGLTDDVMPEIDMDMFDWPPADWNPSSGFGLGWQ